MSDAACRLLLRRQDEGEGRRKAKEDGRTRRRRRRREEPSDRAEAWCLEAGILVRACSVGGEEGGRESEGGALDRGKASCAEHDSHTQAQLQHRQG